MKALVLESQFILHTEVESIVSTCFRALDGSNYDVRCHVSQLLAFLLAECLKVKNLNSGRPMCEVCFINYYSLLLGLFTLLWMLILLYGVYHVFSLSKGNLSFD